MYPHYTLLYIMFRLVAVSTIQAVHIISSPSTWPVAPDLQRRNCFGPAAPLAGVESSISQDRVNSAESAS